jgi:glycosyltransferase involved in cell wall biosynthesis
MTDPLSSLTIAIPAFNEAAHVAAVVEDSLAALAACTTRGEVLVLDDGSTDGTLDIIQSLAKDHADVRWLSHQSNLGFPRSLRDLLRDARGDWVAFIPADGQIPPAEILKLVTRVAAYDIVIGRRWPRQDSWKRRWMARLYNASVSVIVRQRLTDVDGPFLIRRAILDGLPWRTESLFIQAELCAQARLQGFNIAQVTIAHRPRTGGTSRAVHWGSVWSALRDMARYWASRHTRTETSR